MEVGLSRPFPAVRSPSVIANCGGGGGGSSSSNQLQEMDLDAFIGPQPQPLTISQMTPWIGAGLENLGNTCFLNAVLQCLVHTVPLVRALRALDHKRRCSCFEEEQFCSLCAFQLLMEQCLRPSDGAVEPDLLVNNLSHISSSFRRFQQEDAHEFLLCFLDSLENCYNRREPKGNPSSKDGNLVQNIFGGRLQSQVKCCSCGHISGMFEPMVDLSLEIDDSDTLVGALESFTNVEKMDDPENKFTCEGCKEQVFAEKQLKLDRLPDVILLQLKRFKSTGYFSNKIDKHVDYPMELDLAPYVAAASSNERCLNYDLYAVLVHDGWSAYSGHYYCVVRSSSTTWHLMDDSEVREISEEQASSRQAYILFYVRRGTSPWFSTLLKEELGISFHNVMQKQTSPSSVLDPSGPIWASSPERENRDRPVSAAKADVEMESVDDQWIQQLDRELLRSSSPPADVGEPGVSGSGPLCDREPSRAQHVVTSRPVTSSEEQASRTSDLPLTTPPRIAREEDLKKVFYDEQFDDDDKENYMLVRPGSAQATPVRLSPTQVKESGAGPGDARKREILNRQMLHMPSGRRRALMAHISPSHWSGGSEGHHKKKRRTHSL